MKITFVYPRIPYFYDQTPYPPLGIGYLSASIKDSVNTIDCIDGQILNKDGYEQAVSKINSDVVCISATLPQMKEARRVADEVKTNQPSTQVVIGGYGPNSLLPQDVFQMGKFDIFVKGEGEITLRRVINCLRRGEDLKNIPGIVFIRDGKIITTGINLDLPDLDSLPLPNRELFDTPLYLETWKRNVGISSLHMFASRGCPFSCTFCDKMVTGKIYRSRTPESVVDEMQQLWQRYQPDDIFLFDDLFTLKRERVLQICQEIKRRFLSFKWSAQGKVGLVDTEILAALKDAGCTELYFGVESGSNKILSFFKKGFTREQVIKTFAVCHEVGLRAGAYLIVGVPGETKEDIDLTIDLVKTIKPSLLNLSFLTPFPNTQLYKDTAQWIGKKDWSEWDFLTKKIYEYPFEIDPSVSRQRIFDAYKHLIEEGMEYSTYQLLK